MYLKNGLNKFLAPLPGTEKFLGGSTRSLAYTDHIIQFGLNRYTLLSFHIGQGWNLFPLFKGYLQVMTNLNISLSMHVL